MKPGYGIVSVSLVAVASDRSHNDPCVELMHGHPILIANGSAVSNVTVGTVAVRGVLDVVGMLHPAYFEDLVVDSVAEYLLMPALLVLSKKALVGPSQSNEGCWCCLELPDDSQRLANACNSLIIPFCPGHTSP